MGPGAGEVVCNNVSCHDAVVEQVMEGALRLSAALDRLGPSWRLSWTSLGRKLAFIL